MNTATRALVSSALFLLVGCATTSGVVVNPNVKHANYTSAMLITHGGKSSDMDANLQRSLLENGLGVTVGLEGQGAGNSDLLVRYADEWKWDITMYLRSFDLMIYDAKSNTLLASGNWKNSAMHGFFDERKVVHDVVRDTLAKIKAP